MRWAARGNALFAVVLACAAVVWALPFRQPDCNTGSHYALVQTLAQGSKTIDRIHGQSCDISWWHGHYYANKAPGLALATVPWYLVVKSVGLLHADPAATADFPRAMRAMPRRDLWLMGLWGAVLPALLLLVLVRRLAERLAPGTGTAAAALLAFVTLLAPFGGLFFSHAFSALLVFASFSVAAPASGERRAALAGLLAGLAVVVEYPDAIALLAIGAYLIILAGRRLRTAGAYAAGSLIGLAPLVAYGWWAFGNPLHLSYVGAVLVPGVTGHDVLGANSIGFFGVQVPHVGRALGILAGGKGLLAVSPVLALAPFGVRRLWLAGHRRESGFITGLALLFFLYNAGYYSPLGGATPGPRFLVAILPFLAIAAASAAPERATAAAALVLGGGLVLLAADVTQPLISPPFTTRHWWYWTRHGTFTSTIVAPGSHAWYGPAVMAACTAAALAVAARSLHWTSRGSVKGAAVAVAGWSCALFGYDGLSHTASGRWAIAASIVALAAATRFAGARALAAAVAVAAAVTLSPSPGSCLIVTGLLAALLAAAAGARRPQPSA